MSTKGLLERVRNLRKSLRDKAAAKAVQEDNSLAKALTTRKLVIPRRGPSPYETVTRATTRNHSALVGPDGKAPLFGELYQATKDSLVPRTAFLADAYKSCGGCGLLYKSLECPKCSSHGHDTCKECGEQMMKEIGGGLVCKRCV